MGNNVGAFLCHSVHALTENRHGLVLAIAVDEANGTAERTRARQQHKAYGTSQRRRKIVEEFFGWGKTISTMRRSKHIERFKIRQQAQLTAATYNLVRMCRLLAA